MFYYCVTNYKLSILQQHQFIFSPFPGVRCLAHFIWVLHSGSCKAEIKMSATRESRLGFFQVPSGYWQNSLPCVCRTEDPGVLLAVHQGTVSYRILPGPCYMAPSISAMESIPHRCSTCCSNHSLFLSLVYYSLSLFEEPVNIKEEHLIIMV